MLSYSTLVPDEDPDTEDKFLKIREENIKKYAEYHKYTPLTSNAIGISYFYCNRFKKIYTVHDESNTLSEYVSPFFKLCNDTDICKRILELNCISDESKTLSDYMSSFLNYLQICVSVFWN